MGKEWKVMEFDKGIEISMIKSNNLGCLWALDTHNDVFILIIYILYIKHI